MSIFVREAETKRVIFNVRMDLALRLERAKEEARALGRKLDVDSTVDKAMEKFLKKAEKRLAELRGKEPAPPCPEGPQAAEPLADDGL